MNKKADPRPICVIAEEIKATWGQGSMSNIDYGAKPYLSAMCCLKSINDDYGADDAQSIIMYFLANATKWKGEEARRIKKELNDLLKGAR